MSEGDQLDQDGRTRQQWASRYFASLRPRIGKLAAFWYDSLQSRSNLRAARIERSHQLPLSRDEIVLIVLALAKGESFTPVQIQKSLFLASDKVASAFRHDSRYDFQPYDYGPFDRQVYSDVEVLERMGLAQVNQQPGSRWRTYSASPRGVAQGHLLAERLTGEQRQILDTIVKLVRSLSFNDLVSAIYRAYPNMRERSVFRD
jgi:hypothetical protein